MTEASRDRSCTGETPLTEQRLTDLAQMLSEWAREKGMAGMLHGGLSVGERHILEDAAVACRELSTCKRDLDLAVTANAGQAAYRKQAEAELSACKKDAGRYRWLRECQSIPAGILLNHHDALDAAIDAAMQKEKA